MPRQLRLTRALNGVGQTNTDMVDSACFSLYFQDTGSRALIQRRHLNITRLEMIRKLVQRAGRPQWTVCREPEQESREAQSKKEKEKTHLIEVIFGMIVHWNWIICSLYSVHLRITLSWLWLKQNLLVSVDTDISQCLPPVSLSTLHTSSWQLLHWINHDYWLTCTQQSAQAQPELCFLSAKLI